MEMIEKYDLYIDGKLEGGELEAFLLQLKNDKKLEAELAMHREINESITDDEVYYLRQKLALLISSSLKKQVFLRTFSGIASGIIIVLSIFAITHTTDPGDAFNNYYRPYETDLNTRSADNNVQGTNLAYKLYASGEYEAAYEILKNYTSVNVNHSDAKYYQGLCAIELKNAADAEESLRSVIKDGDYAYALHAKWYLSMLYLQTKQNENARSLLKELAETPNFYSERSRKILKKYF
jgi:TolA-binding protein